ncbi:B12-binding domain-containing radical SAM protein [Piscinibacter sakaiensis]|uniref:Radical SAM domain protein n=1 Tax=Piscinibacter sakaiensis TaxID=1547922 RepID=A0A0K8P6D0_PISS1|nr:radical SAM protein [Piscinibacter sakaiensis]GAP38258.1 radical SAM domain protein [Piscinibacter sakaiensis]
MHVLFLEVDTESAWAVASLGPAFLAATLRAQGHGAGFFRVTTAVGLDEVRAAVAREQPDLIGVSVTTRQWLRARDLLAGLREHVDVPVILGGLHATFSPEEVLRHPGIDYVCLGEGEAALLELVEALREGRALRDARLGRIRNIWARGGLRPGLRPPIEPIDAIPFAARDLLDERWGVVHVSTQRGCPFPCTYCGARMYDELYAGEDGPAYGRRRSHGNVLAELRALRDAGALNYVIFLDDTFTIHHPWVREFCRRYPQEVGRPFSLHARVETVNPRMLQELAAAGCRLIVYGVESGSPRVRREIMQRSASNQRFVDVFRWTREAGIGVTANYILGTPGETVAEMEETLALHRRLQPDDFGFFVFYPYPGTALFTLCRERGYLPDDYLERPALHRRSILRLPGVSPEDIDAMYARWTEARIDAMVARGVPAQEVAQVREAALAHAACG